jgi:methionyl-tRNA formyltransferase
MNLNNQQIQSSKIRIAVFGSFYRGYYVLSELLAGLLSNKVAVVGVATDDPSQPFVNAQNRVWQYPHTPSECEMVTNLARAAKLEVFTGRVKTADFCQTMQTRWQPDLCIMATFGQKISPQLFETPALGFYNLHPCFDDAWPSRYAGNNPFQALLDDKKPYTQIAMHRVDENFDTGELIAYSEKIHIPAHATVVDLHKITSHAAAQLAVREIEKIIASALSRGYST